MVEVVTDGIVNPISHSLSSPSPVTPLSPNSSSLSRNDSSSVQKVIGSDASRSSMATPTNTIGASKFTLPNDWSVLKVPRKSGGSADKYYIDPESGRQFRSLKEVERYITEGITPARTRPNKPTNHIKKNLESQDIVTDEKVASKIIEDKGDQYELTTVGPTSVSATSTFQLPCGWVVKEVPRSSGDCADKYYFEPGTGQKFRSLAAVEKHLEENSPLSVKLEEIRENSLPISKAFKLNTTIKNYGSYSSWKKNMVSRKEKTSPPSKVNWVLAGTGGNATWNAVMNERVVHDSLKKQWGDTFMVALTNGKQINTPL